MSGRRAPARLGEHLERTVFVLSTGRSGTMAIARTFGVAFHDVVAVHEPRPSSILRLASNCSSCRRVPARWLTVLLRGARRRLCGASRGVYLEANPYLYGFASVLDRVFARVRVIHLVRDPRSYVTSAINSGAASGLKGLVASTFPFASLQPHRAEPQCFSAAKDWSPVERFAWGWTFVNRRLASVADHFGDRYRRVRYEELFRPDGRAARELADWLELREIPGRLELLLRSPVNASRGSRIGPWERWSDGERAHLFAHCGELMQDLGYEVGRTP